ncbi:MAG: 23S rRNA (uracil(1939)-C(5))-methyltransferase RlmD [Gammaproteobacteria bacterium HGW-Gammaproteobacteria-2]|jgi:23S rRNA (uracil1939-C5)-methyltransferase|nr:MAG: 23S rRNA (uracil(1939)-C(5))-methyltransferase RlmD [Gammaproteobacteria bacterium HGW-Gammaproteobacteria-2]
MVVFTHRQPVARSRKVPQHEFTADVTGLSHEGRGVARVDGKVVFVSGALPGESVLAQLTGRNRHFDEARTLQVLSASPDRVVPRCAHFEQCSGCVLQHLDEARQIELKQTVLLENLQRIGHVAAERVLEPLRDVAWGYRRKGRFSVRYVEKKGKILVGFREVDPRFVADLVHCDTVVPAIGERIPAIAAVVDSLDAKRSIPQIEFIAGDEAVALVFRHLEPLSPADHERLTVFAQATGLAVLLQSGGPNTVQPLWPTQLELSFAIPAADIRLQFQPLDFIQVNAGLNQRMIASAADLLQPSAEDRILDLFCGLGNFTLPLARRAGHVVGVEGEAGLVTRARENALRNGIGNAEFFAADLASDLAGEPWLREGFNKLLLDPPRAGAAQVLAQLPLKGITRIVYVSCHPASLARDAGFLVNERGYTLKAAGVMDMFPHTAHVESIALFERAADGH